MTSKLLSPAQVGPLALQNRMVMAPMTRSRAIGNVPNQLMADYYGQRSQAGLIVTEGTSPSPNGLGYSRIPGSFNQEQAKGWKAVAQAAHAGGARIFMQLMHTGRVAHPANLPAGAEMLAPSAIAAKGQMWTDGQGMQDQPSPREMTLDEIKAAQQEFAHAANLAVEAGFDGVELHAANGYLIEQFLAPNSNQRTDQYGGNEENRARFLLETVDAVAAGIGKDKVGVRLSPYGVFNDIMPYSEDLLEHMARELNNRGIAYLHLVNHHSMGNPEVPASAVARVRAAFNGTLILSGGYDKARAEADLQAGHADLVAFGRPFIANPDLPARLAADAELAQPDQNTFYTPGEKGYTDYPVLEEANA